MENYFNYFTEIEDHFQRQRGSTLLLSTLDWALIETWKDAGIPLEAVLRGIDSTFERYHARPAKTRKVNGLAFCSQEVLAAAEDMKEAAVGANPEKGENGELSAADVAGFLQKNAEQLQRLMSGSLHVPDSVCILVGNAIKTLQELASLAETSPQRRFEELERRLTIMEEKLFAALLSASPDEELLQVRAEADRDLAPYRRKMPSSQIEQLHKQYVHKRLLERYGIPRLSLFYL